MFCMSSGSQCFNVLKQIGRTKKNELSKSLEDDCSLWLTEWSEMDYYQWFVRHQCLPLKHFVKT